MLLLTLAMLLLAAGQAPVLGMGKPPAKKSPASKVCGSKFRKGMKLSSSCGADCALPKGVSRAANEDACLAKCAAADDCHCALYDSGKCTQLWTTCDSSVLGLKPKSGGSVALKPCTRLPLTPKKAKATSKRGNCKPMKLYPGWIITRYGCSTSGCKSKVVKRAKTLDSCIDACVKAGFDACKSVQFKPAGSFGLKSAQCTMYDVQLEYMGAHATAQVLARNGLGAVAASYCKPPPGFTDFPTNERPDFGVDWDAVCKGEELAIVDDLNLACSDCVFIPKNRQNRVRDNDFDEFHYQYAPVIAMHLVIGGPVAASKSIDSCAADCKANKNCGCAFFRPTNFKTGSGFCALSNVECEEASIGTEVDFTRIRSAITKCGYRASPKVRKSWPDEAYDPVDWFGIWDDVCEGGGAFTFDTSNTFCGPDCVLPGVPTVRLSTREKCDARCKKIEGCECSYYATKSKRCTLMQESGACNNFDNDPDALAYDLDFSTQNDVTVQCGSSFDFYYG